MSCEHVTCGLCRAALRGVCRASPAPLSWAFLPVPFGEQRCQGDRPALGSSAAHIALPWPEIRSSYLAPVNPGSTRFEICCPPSLLLVFSFLLLCFCLDPAPARR